MGFVCAMYAPPLPGMLWTGVSSPSRDAAPLRAQPVLLAPPSIPRALSRPHHTPDCPRHACTPPANDRGGPAIPLSCAGGRRAGRAENKPLPQCVPRAPTPRSAGRRLRTAARASRAILPRVPLVPLLTTSPRATPKGIVEPIRKQLAHASRADPAQPVPAHLLPVHDHELPAQAQEVGEGGRGGGEVDCYCPRGVGRGGGGGEGEGDGDLAAAFARVVAGVLLDVRDDGLGGAVEFVEVVWRGRRCLSCPLSDCSIP